MLAHPLRRSPPPASTQAGALPLVGRASELALLRRALADGAEGSGGTIFLHGEPGIGKTRLVREAADLAARRGWLTAMGRAYPVEQGMAYAAFADAVVPLLNSFDRATLSTLTRGGTELTQLFPALASPDAAGHAARDTLGTSPAELKSRLFWNFSQFLARLAARQPLLLVIENLQWADASSVELLHFVARQIRTERILLLCTFTEAERDLSVALHQAKESLVSLGAAAAHQLEPLTRADVEELLAKLLRAGPEAHDFATLLYGWTRGNPFFVEETVKALVDDGRLTQHDGRWVGWEIAELGLPMSVRHAVRARVGRLSSSARSLAETAAVLGTRPTFGELQAVSGQAERELVASIEELCAQRILALDDGGTRWDFAHPIVRDTIYREIGPARVRMLHGMLAHALERHHGSRAGKHAGELASHFRLAGVADGSAGEFTGKAAHYLIAAGRAALAAHANREAADDLETALALVERTSEPGRPEPDVSLVEDLARARQRLGEYAAAEQLWRRVRDDAERAHRLERVAVIERRLGLNAFWSGRHHVALAHYDLGVAAARSSSATAQEARLLVDRAWCLHALGLAVDAQRAVEPAVAIAESLADPALLARVHAVLSSLHGFSGSVWVARDYAARLVELADRADERVLGFFGRWQLAWIAIATGEAVTMQTQLRELKRLADELRSPVLRIYTADLLVHYKTAFGEWESALAIAEQAIADARNLEDRSAGTPRTLMMAALIYLERGNIEQGKRYVDEVWRISGAEGADASATLRDVHAVLAAYTARAYYHMRRFELEDAIRIAKRGLAIADQPGYVMWAIYRLLPVLAESYFRAGRIELGDEVAERLRAEAERSGNKFGLAWARAAASLGLLVREEWDRALVITPEAIATLESLPLLFDAARLRRELARGRACTGDRDGAIRDLRLAHDVFLRAGANAELGLTREQMRKVGVRPPSRVVPGSGIAGLTGRETEIARMVASRKSNKDIGAALGISARTVGTHLSNMFEKLGVASRQDLADVVREHK